jgi:hypothetical protein
MNNEIQAVILNCWTPSGHTDNIGPNLFPLENTAQPGFTGDMLNQILLWGPRSATKRNISYMLRDRNEGFIYHAVRIAHALSNPSKSLG